MNLLIVDDEIVTTQVLEEQLDRELLSIDQIYVAYNTSMARDILQKNKVELILCDIEMPKENGIHFLKWVREQKIQTEVIFLTSHEKFGQSVQAPGQSGFFYSVLQAPASIL